MHILFMCSRQVRWGMYLHFEHLCFNKENPARSATFQQLCHVHGIKCQISLMTGASVGSSYEDLLLEYNEFR